MLTLRGIDHVVLRVADIEVMRRFYCDILGATHVAYRPQFGMSHLRVGQAMIDLVEAKRPDGAGRNMDHLCLRVEPFDQQAVVTHLERHGVKVGDIRIIEPNIVRVACFARATASTFLTVPTRSRAIFCLGT